MAVTPRSNVSPLKSEGFYSFLVTIPDDDFCSWASPTVVGNAIISSNDPAAHGLAWYRGTASAKLGGPATFLCVNTALTGTTGTDGNLTFGSNGSLNYLENRSGGQLTFIITMISYQNTFE